MRQEVAGVPLAPAIPRPKVRVRNSPTTAWARARERLAWLLVLPSVLVVVLVALYPLYRTFQYSFTNARLGSNRWEYVGWRNYQRLFNDSVFTGAFQNTIIFTVATVALETIFGMVIALVINSNFRGRGLIRTSMLIPWAIPTVVSAQMWAWMYNDVYGVFNDFLVKRVHLLNQPVAWLGNPNRAMGAIIVTDVWKTTPFMALLLLAGLQVIPGDIYEASTVDGANKWQQFWQMTLPMLRPALLVALIFRTLDAFRVFDVIRVMKEYDPSTMSLAVYAQQKLFAQRAGLGVSSATSVVILLCILALVIIYTRLVRVEEG